VCPHAESTCAHPESTPVSTVANWLYSALKLTGRHGQAQVDLHYNGFCNSVLWQLFHYVPLNTDTKLSETRTLQFQWNAYQDANRCRLWALLLSHSYTESGNCRA